MRNKLKPYLRHPPGKCTVAVSRHKLIIYELTMSDINQMITR